DPTTGTAPTDAALEAYKLRRSLLNEQVLVDEVRLRRAQDLAQARALTAYLTSEIDPAYYGRNVLLFQDWFKQAVDLWEKVLAEGAEAPIVEEAKKDIAELKKRQNSVLSPKPPG